MVEIAHPRHRKLFLMAALTAFVGVGLMSFPAWGQKQSNGRQVERSGKKKRLSQLLPEKLGEFVLKSGTDREVTSTTAERIEIFLRGEADVLTVSELLRPADIVEYASGALEVLGGAKAEKPDAPTDSAQSQLIAVSNVALNDGTELGVGDHVLVGDSIAAGLVINAGTDKVFLSTKAGETIEIGVGVVLNAGGCTWVEQCDANGNCTNKCVGTCSIYEKCLKITITNDDGSTTRFCDCIRVPE